MSAQALIPPHSVMEPVTDIWHGTPVSDPFRWLEDSGSNATREWIAEQLAYSQSYFSRLADRNRIHARVAELLQCDDILNVMEVGGTAYLLIRRAHEEQPSIIRRTAERRDEIIVSGDGIGSLQLIGVSPDNRFLAFGLRNTGADTQAVHFVDLAENRIVPDFLAEGYGPGLVFRRKPFGFYYTHQLAGEPAGNKRVLSHSFGDSVDREVYFGGTGADLHVGVLGSLDANLLIYLRLTTKPSTKLEVYVHRVGEEEGPRKLFVVEGFIASFFLVGHDLYALTDYLAPNFRFVRIDLNSSSPDCWQDIVPESSCALKEVTVVANHFCLRYEDAEQSIINIYDLTGQCIARNISPPRGTAKLFSHSGATRTLFYSFSSYTQPATIYAFDVPARKQALWWRQELGMDLSGLEIEQVTFNSFDGTSVPLLLAATRPRPGASPTFITGYGGFGTCITPKFNVYSAFLMEQGFLFAVPAIRGGGESGPQWHEAGKRTNRQVAFTDFTAAVEWLIDKRRSVLGKIAIGGGSNAGLLVGAVMTQRPDLFQAVLCAGPLLDMLRYHLFDFAALFREEYGVADNPSDFEHLYQYSPYHNVRPGTCYPSVLFISGDADTRCNPMHVRKMVAALQAATSCQHPILMQYTPTWGHTAVQPLRTRIDALANRLGFLLNELGVSMRN